MSTNARTESGRREKRPFSTGEGSDSDHRTNVDGTRGLWKRVRSEAHPRCVVCDPKHASGLRLAFSLLEDGSVQGRFDCGEAYEGYTGMLHGGVVSTLLDGAMTNCLFANGLRGVTGELNVRFRHPVVTNRESCIRAWIERSVSPYHVLKSEIVQDDQIKARATGKFVECMIKSNPGPPE